MMPGKPGRGQPAGGGPANGWTRGKGGMLSRDLEQRDEGKGPLFREEGAGNDPGDMLGRGHTRVRADSIASAMVIDKDNLIQNLSSERMRTYIQIAGGNRDIGIEWYELNQQLSASLYVPLQNLEVGLRNGLHGVLAAHHGETWFDGHLPLKPWQAKAVQEAKDGLRNRRKPQGPGGIIAELNFGFWTALFDPLFDQPIWHKGHLKQLFKYHHPGSPGLNRQMFSGVLNEIRRLRNRVFHHEPILKLNMVYSTHESLCQLLGMLCPDLFAWNRLNDRFPTTHAACTRKMNENRKMSSQSFESRSQTIE